MTNKQKEVFRTRISKYSGADLKLIKKMVDEQIKADYEKIENFMYHETVDEYLYVVNYEDGTSNLFSIGADAYERYRKRSDAISVERKTKRLFPTYEIILSRDERKQKAIRH